jgi:hypothetical protein
MAAVIHARRDPLDKVWLARVRIELAKEDHEIRSGSRDTDALKNVRERTHHLYLVNQEIDLLDTADHAAAEKRRVREDEEKRATEERELERRIGLAEYDARVERERREAQTRGLDPETISAMDELREELADAEEDGVSREDAFFATAFSRIVDSEMHIAEMAECVARLEDKSGRE